MQINHAQVECPTADDLRRYLAGESASSKFQSLDGHLANCPRCQQRVEELSESRDSISLLIANAVQCPPIHLPVGLQQSLEHIRSEQKSENCKGIESMDFEKIMFIRDYRILESIGEGGMGCVFRAIHTRLNRSVAIKILRQDRVNSKEAISRFDREMKLIAQLEHPNIVKALDAGEQNGLHYLVMEFLAGVDIGQLSKRMGPLPIADACQIIRFAAIALQYAHDQKIIHRDIKPSNLLLTPDGCIKLLDLGLAQFFDFSNEPPLSRTDQAIGTLAYMAPEQLSRREEVTTRSDIFSLGVSLHELLTGQRPFERPGQSPLLAELSTIRPDVDEPLDRLIGEMVANASTNRPLTMQEVADRLTPYVATADLSSLMTEYYRWSNRKTSASLSRVAPSQMELGTANPNSSQSPGDLTLSDRPTFQRVTNMENHSLRKWLVLACAIATAMLLGAVGAWRLIVPITGQDSQTDISKLDPPVIDTGELEVTALGDVAKDLLDTGSVFAIPKESSEKDAVSLREGLNPMEPGIYSVILEGPEVFEPLEDVRIVKGANRKLQLTASLTKAFQYPTIPVQVGDHGAYSGSLWLKDWPPGVSIPFNIRLQVLSIEKRQSGSDLTCLKFETITHHPTGDFEEIGYLKIDTEKWRTLNRFEVEEGFVRAIGPDIAAWVQDNRPEKKNKTLVVPFQKDVDRLKEVAGDALPSQRLSLHDYIALFFGDASMPVARDSIRGLRPMLLKSGERNSWIQPVANSSGFVPCFVVSSRKREDSKESMGYMMARSKAEPFGFVRMEANTPTIIALCAVTSSGPATVDSNEFDLIAREFVQEKDVPLPKRFWDRATIPNTDQPASTTWQGSISIANAPPQVVEATARSLGSEMYDNRNCQWIEVEVSSTLENGEEEHWEAARLLVDVQKYQETGLFEAKKGWFAFGNKKDVFECPDDEDLSAIIDQRLKLSDSMRQFRRFSVLDALSMLFAAEFTPASLMSNLRKAIVGEKQGLAPTRTSVEIETGFGRTMRGERWESPKGVDVDYAIQRTPGVAFDFFSVNLEQQRMAKISLQVENAGSTFGSVNPVLGTPKQLAELSDATRTRIDELSKPNWRVWSWKHRSGVNFKAWAEFGGMLNGAFNNDRSKAEILLRNRNGQEVAVPANALDDNDWNWARKGRLWVSVSPNFRQEQMALIEDKGKELWIARPNGIVKPQFDQLVPEDKEFIDGLRAFQKRKPDTSDPLPKWLEFAPYVRK